MELEEIRVRDRLKTRGLKHKAMIEIMQNPRSGEFVIVMATGIHKEWGVFNLPDGMWRAKCTREEIPGVVGNFLAEKVLAE